MRAFVVEVSEPDVDAASDMLWQLGVRAIEERTGIDGIELWTAVGDEPEAISRAVAALHGRWQHRVVEVVDEPAQTWREHAVPMRVDDGLVILPAWLDVTGPAGATAVFIEPGGAFGLGDHPTTMLSLRALRRLLDDTIDAIDVIDVGCGTGVLAVTAAVLRSRLQDRPVRAIDVASAAVEATLDNARRNGVAGRVLADTTDLADVDGDYDLVVANILAPVLVSLAADLRRVTRPGGRLVISGILAGSHQHVLDALAPMHVERTDELDGWACVVLHHQPDRR
ncbi:MAG TPA: 50S ribosomal protein L11 methyltransferase [Ilumatobacteraceae bacterium]|nr:50S ribosomal protein L11 methyltransferase [Ilumatobacteraceae bacterium]